MRTPPGSPSDFGGTPSPSRGPEQPELTRTLGQPMGDSVNDRPPLLIFFIPKSNTFDLMASPTTSTRCIFRSPPPPWWLAPASGAGSRAGACRQRCSPRTHALRRLRSRLAGAVGPHQPAGPHRWGPSPSQPAGQPILAGVLPVRIGRIGFGFWLEFPFQSRTWIGLTDLKNGNLGKLHNE